MCVKYEDWKIALSFFMTEALMFSFDLKSGYHHIKTFEGHQTYNYLGFSWKHGSSKLTKFYVVRSLPFGLSPAPQIFTKTIKLWKNIGNSAYALLFFLTMPGWAIERDRQVCSSIAGLVTNDEK